MPTPALSIRELHKTFHLGLFAPIPWARGLRLGALNRVVEAVRGVSFEVGPGEIFGLLGANGAGKSTTIKSAMGLICPSAGEVELNGLSAHEPAARVGVAYLPENPVFYDELSPLETLELFGALCGVPARDRRREAREQLGRVGMSHAESRPLRLLSKGMHQRVGIAQALLNQPKLLILDEPLSGLDPVGRRAMRELLLEERERGASVLLSSHILPDMEALCDRFGMIHQGQLKRLAEMSSLAREVEEFELSLAPPEGALSSAQLSELEALGAQLKPRQPTREGLVELSLPISARAQALELVVRHELPLRDLRERRLSLDDLFERIAREERS